MLELREAFCCYYLNMRNATTCLYAYINNLTERKKLDISEEKGNNCWRDVSEQRKEDEHKVEKLALDTNMFSSSVEERAKAE